MEKPKGRGAWRAAVHGVVAQSRTWLRQLSSNSRPSVVNFCAIADTKAFTSSGFSFPQSVLKEINSEYFLAGLLVKLKLQYFGHLMQRADIGKDPDVGRDWGQKKKGEAEDKMVR